MRKWKKQKHSGLAIYNTKAAMFSKMHILYFFLRFIILKSENNIFENVIYSDDLPLKTDLACLNSFPMAKTEL